ncbi:hypothetical protein B0T14DRAFT_562858 [Immersiella caudata]|uniref:Uncharacterized protein n=1 Tax=Immersiella caudata TaxID=314043 RepID=A0AA39X475_9PEZI|nr:hypothetical protein B0T14DRAFT_562858 [Immersiella caudata]
MAGTPVKQSFQTLESQKRLMAALLASLPGTVKIDYNAVARCYGGGATASAVEHQCRAVRKMAIAMTLCVNQGLDPQRVTPDIVKTVTKDMKDEELHRIYGTSTPGGLGYQVQNLKAVGKRMKDAADNGGDPVAAFNSPTTPGSRKRVALETASAPRSRARAPPTGGSSTRRPPKKVKKEEFTTKDSSSSEKDYEELDLSPTPVRRKRSDWGTATATATDMSRASTLVNEDEAAATPVKDGKKAIDSKKATPKTASKRDLTDDEMAESLIMKPRVKASQTPAAMSNTPVSTPAQPYSGYTTTMAQPATAAPGYGSPTAARLASQLFRGSSVPSPAAQHTTSAPYHEPASNFSMATGHMNMAMAMGYEDDDHDIYDDHSGEI